MAALAGPPFSDDELAEIDRYAVEGGINLWARSSAAVNVPLGAPVTRAFRRILSGSPDGRPDWVLALERPGDVGWFGPDSAIWAVHGSLATLVGGVRALLLQAAHPLALAGVVEPLRLPGRPARAAAAHQPLPHDHDVRQLGAGRGRRSRGSARRTGPCTGRRRTGARTTPPTRRLLLWVHVALTDSMLRAAQAYGPRDVDADSYVAEAAVVATALGIADPPRSAAALGTVLEAYLPELSADESTRSVVRFLMAPPLPIAAQPAYQVLCTGGRRPAAALGDPAARPAGPAGVRPRGGRGGRARCCWAACAPCSGPQGPGERAAAGPGQTRRPERSQSTRTGPFAVRKCTACRPGCVVDPVDLDPVERVRRRLAEPARDGVGVPADLHPAPAAGRARPRRTGARRAGSATARSTAAAGPR